MLKVKTIIILAVAMLCSCNQQPKDVLDYVDPFIGTGAHGHTFPGATTPFGMVQLSPSNDFKGWDWCSGYHKSDSVLKGFAHTHVSGTGLAGLGDILMMPTSGEVKTNPGTESNPESGFRSRFSHDKEKASAGYYYVNLTDYEIDVELTSSPRVGFHRYTFNKGGKSNVVIDPTHNIMEKVFATKLEIISDTEIRGYKKCHGEGGDRKIFFKAQFSKPFDKSGIVSDGKNISAKNIENGSENRAFVTFNNLKRGEVVEVKVALSFTGLDGANKNFIAEASTKNFDKALSESKKIWRDVISKIDVEKASLKQKRILYSGLYHMYIAPNTISDVDGKYWVDGRVEQSKHKQFSTYSTWDTFRATHPMFTIIDKERTSQIANSLISRYTEQKLTMPIWELCGNDNACMIAYSPVSVIADAALKGIKGVSLNDAFEASKYTALNFTKVSPNSGGPGTKELDEFGFIPSEIIQSVSKNMETSYMDWCIYMMAKKLKRNDDTTFFMKRAHSIFNLYNEENGWFWPRSMGGKPVEIDFSGWKDLQRNYISGNIWGYSTFVPHAMQKLIKIKGGNAEFNKWLDKIFADTTQIGGHAHVDISGFIGKYGHGDEPSHQMPYLYNYSGQPWKSQKLVRQSLSSFYDDTPEGIENNEDCGQMSAWYIFSSLGFYPVCPGDQKYIFGSPLLEKASLVLEDGKRFTVVSKNNSEDNVYINKVVLNGKKITRNYITHSEIMSGGELVFYMSDKPNRSRGVNSFDLPDYGNSNKPVEFEEPQRKKAYTPYELNSTNVFNNKRVVTLKSYDYNAKIRYTLNGKEPDNKSKLYTKPIILRSDVMLKSKAFLGGMKSSEEFSREYYKTSGILEKAKITLVTKPKRYGMGDGSQIFDKKTGSVDFNDGSWSGFDGENLEVILDFPTEQKINSIVVGALTSTFSWIFPPKSVEVYTIDATNKETLAGKLNVDMPLGETKEINRFKINVSKKSKRFKLVVRHTGKLPKWHGGSGNIGWMFIDEVVVK